MYHVMYDGEEVAKFPTYQEAMDYIEDLYPYNNGYDIIFDRREDAQIENA